MSYNQQMSDILNLQSMEANKNSTAVVSTASMFGCFTNTIASTASIMAC